MSLRSFISKQFIDVIHWAEPEAGILAYRFPMQDMEIQNGGQLTVRESQMAIFVNEGKVADLFPPGQYTLTTQTLPILTYLRKFAAASGRLLFANSDLSGFSIFEEAQYRGVTAAARALEILGGSAGANAQLRPRSRGRPSVAA